MDIATTVFYKVGTLQWMESKYQKFKIKLEVIAIHKMGIIAC
jgi:hypothetical protein